MIVALVHEKSRNGKASGIWNLESAARLRPGRWVERIRETGRVGVNPRRGFIGTSVGLNSMIN